MTLILAAILAPFVALALLLGGWRARRRRSLVPLLGPLIALLFDVVLVLNYYAHIHYWDGYDLNPVIANTELVGIWQLDGASLTLREDGTCSTGAGQSGTWWREGDFDVLVSGEREFRVARGPDGLVLCAACRRGRDPDEWLRVLWTRRR